LIHRRAALGLTLALVAGALLLSGPRAGTRPIRLSVAVSLRPAVEEATAGQTVQLNSGGSGVLFQQIRRGAPADILISASPREIARLLEEQLALQPTRRRLATNRLLVVVPRDAAPPSSFTELARTEFEKIVVANPRTAPLGRYTRQALEAAGLWEALQTRLVFVEDARRAVNLVSRGEVSAGIVYSTDARLRADRLQPGPTIPSALHDVAIYEGIVLRDAANVEDAVRLLDRLASQVGREVFARHGFSPP